MNNSRTWQLLNILADGQFYSGEQLAQQLNLSRASISNALANVETLGVSLQRIRGRGYKLSKPWQQLNAQRIQQQLNNNTFHIEILPEASSSNTLLLQRCQQNAPSGSVLAVELQTAGRGRMGRTWHSGLGNALTFSLLWRFNCGLNALSGLSLVVGVAIVRALHKLDIHSAQLKWPNDILSKHGKLGGVLIEAQGDMLGPSAVVIGIGLNLHLPRTLSNQIDQAACALDEICNQPPERNLLLANILQELEQTLSQFAQQGFVALREEWQQYHLYQNQTVHINMGDGSKLSGIARGVSANGALQLETAQGLQLIHSGEICTA